MARGAGKYDHLATHVRIRTKARCAAVFVLDGVKGGGFSVQSSDAALLHDVPAFLRKVADEMEREMRASCDA